MRLTQPSKVHFSVGAKVEESYLPSSSSETIADESEIKSQKDLSFVEFRSERSQDIQTVGSFQ